MSLSCLTVDKLLFIDNLDWDDDGKCLEYFHRFQTIKRLQQVRDTIGPDAFAGLYEHFDGISNSGFSLEEVVNTDTAALFERDGWEDIDEEQTEHEEWEYNDEGALEDIESDSRVSDIGAGGETPSSNETGGDAGI